MNGGQTQAPIKEHIVQQVSMEGERMPTGPWVQALASLLPRWMLAVLFIITGLAKAQQPWAFVHALEHFAVLPAAMTQPFGMALPWIEILIGAYLLLGLFTRAAALAAGMLLIFFIVILVVRIARGATTGCSCTLNTSDNPIVNTFLGGTSIGVVDVLRDGALLLLALALARLALPVLAVDALLIRRHSDQPE
jgi:uncharacterized membrane protein YphA (DoxX/SURF4 family)